ncbi:radical SAM/SPASM domain-containing protein [Texcoconibacillus texcoconensis]|uniref:Radical SAM core domain-containing protein n=1 Tax=Texcoconibacillus texcoconensis TaxID=1095777 RepID=A0A840QQJ5_9BACI|nr:radical SAM protein [Texcoconibacillus texcoconensis]MBB5173712.1 uncharacterized protein [Texcoconibacillus texcoconensis]
MNEWKKSRFNVTTETESDELLIYNSYTGAIATIDPPEKQEALQILKNPVADHHSSELIRVFKEQGFLVKSSIDEKKRAQDLHESVQHTDSMHLVLLPTEACNFRCTYCYETFQRGNMNEDVREGLKAYMNQKANQLSNLMVSWFGGEPLLALDEIIEVSESFLETAERHDIAYQAEMSTNGYYLTEETFRKLLQLEIRQFMITIDGLEDVHNQRRGLAQGGGTFSTIIDNLKKIKLIPGDFEIFLRINFDEHNRQDVRALITYLSELFADDDRFQVLVRPVARWGGENDENIPVCDGSTAHQQTWSFTDFSIDNNLKVSSQIEQALMPTGSVCYAAKPNSLVIGADGHIYKCTLAFDEPFNQLGQLHRNGTVTLDYDKIAEWTMSGENQDEHCQACFFRPACQGNHCPFYRRTTGFRPCSFEKQNIKKVLQLIWKSHTLT